MTELPNTNPYDVKTTIVGAIVAAQMCPGGKTKPRGPIRPKVKAAPVEGWKVCQCPSCGHIAVSRSRFKLYCKRCGRSFNLRKAGRWNVKTRLFNSEVEAVAACQRWKEAEI